MYIYIYQVTRLAAVETDKELVVGPAAAAAASVLLLLLLLLPRRVKLAKAEAG